MAVQSAVIVWQPEKHENYSTFLRIEFPEVTVKLTLLCHNTLQNQNLKVHIEYWAADVWVPIY